MKISPRSNRFAGSLDTLVNEFIHKNTDPDNHGFLTVTAIEVSGDLQVCDVFVRSLQGPKDWMSKLKTLEKSASHFLTTSVNRRQRITVRFKPDASVKLVEDLKDKL